MSILIQDRVAAGRDLARSLLEYRKQADAIVLALPRGGVPVAAEIAHALHAPLDIIVVRKLGTPGQEELAMGAIASGGIRVLNQDIVSSLGISEDVIERVAAREHAELERRMKAYRGERAWPSVKGKRVILVDDGVATGATMRAAIAALRSQAPAKVIVAVPVAPFDTLAQLRGEADEVVCLATPEPFRAIGLWYASFPQLSDEEVRRVLSECWAEYDAAAGERAPRRAKASGSGRAANGDRTRELAARPTHEEEVAIRAGSVALEGTLRLPGPAHGLVVFAHGSGSGRFSTRNRYVAEYLNEVGLATLLFDLLTAREQEVDDRTGELRFDIGLLGSRLTGVLDWVATQPVIRGLPVGVFGASTGAAAALSAAAARPQQVAAVVSRGGRPDLAQASLALVRAPTLLIVGGLDNVVIGLNQQAATQLRCKHRLEIVPGASHLFEESGKLESVARLARSWFEHHLRGAAARESFGGAVAGAPT